MMISPDWFVEELKDKSYKELLSIRDKLIRQIRSFEKHTYDPKLDTICPSPDVVYQCNLQYLSKLCDLIAEKYNSEIVWGNNKP